MGTEGTLENIIQQVEKSMVLANYFPSRFVVPRTVVKESSGRVIEAYSRHDEHWSREGSWEGRT